MAGSGEEVVMIVKTRATLTEPVAAAVKHMRSYAPPANVVLPVEGGDPAYLGWIAAEIKARQVEARQGYWARAEGARLEFMRNTLC